ncbi:MAG TPA: hypothetical protein VK939_14845 [Longimicrobiales bacterium]|nr:hypothetical protein [Longimicrobiales bacterium]
MKRLLVLGAAALSLGLAACGGGELVVQAAIEGADGQPKPLANVPVRALPFDRDIVFTELEEAHGTPQPAIPDSLMALQDQIAAANQQWSDAEAIWGSARDSLKVLSDRMRNMSRGSGQYAVAFREFTRQEGIVQQAERAQNAAFARFESLQSRYNQEAEEIRLRRDQWADEAFVSIDSVFLARTQESGREARADTTDANGVARLGGLKSGQWWVYARYELPYEELYWNVPVDVQGGDPITVPLNRQNAQVRPKL